MRDFRLRYRQTFLGVIWVLLQPLAAGLIFAVVFGLFAKLPYAGGSYFEFILPGMVLWTFVSTAVQRGCQSLLRDAQLVSKVYFPRVILPISAMVSAFLDFLVGLVLVLFIATTLGHGLDWRIFWMIPAVALSAGLSLGLGLGLAALNVQYRDVSYSLPFILQLWMYSTPIVYSPDVVPPLYRDWLMLNPLSTLIEMQRAAVGMATPGLVPCLVASVLTGVVLMTGFVLFKHCDRKLAEIV